jgi:hypothetical protein
MVWLVRLAVAFDIPIIATAKTSDQWRAHYRRDVRYFLEIKMYLTKWYLAFADRRIFLRQCARRGAMNLY